MFTRSPIGYAFGALFTVTIGMAQSAADQDFARRVLRMSDAEQIAAIEAYLDEGMPAAQEQGIYGLARSHSSLALPVLAKKIEEVLRAQNPLDCFKNKNVSPDSVVYLASAMISNGDADQALKIFSKLIMLDPKRFGRWVDSTLTHAAPHENGFAIAYKGLDPANPALDDAIAVWAESMLDGAVSDAPRWLQWADALVERYGGVPIGPEWNNDPIVSRLKPDRAESLHSGMLRLNSAAWERSPRRMAAMSDTDRIQLVKSVLERRIPQEQREALAVLARTRSSLILPLIEAHVEALLKTPDQIEFKEENAARRDRFLTTAMGIIAEAGDEQALRQLAKLMKTLPAAKLTLQGLVSTTLGWAGQRSNIFTLAYRGLDIGDHDLDVPIMFTVEQFLAEPSLNTTKDPRRLCASAMIVRYGALPTPEQWAKDPLVSRLKPNVAESFHADLVRFRAEAEKSHAQE